MTRMPFGCHKGWPIADLPDDYLTWLASIDLRPFLRAAVDEEIAARGLGHHHHRERDDRQDRTRPIAALPPVDPTIALELIAAGRRALAVRHHPDVGGDAAYMTMVNTTADVLREWLAGAA